MEILCDICQFKTKYPTGLVSHTHPEFNVGNVPMNIWTPIYTLSKNGLWLSENEEGILKFKEYFPFDVSNAKSYGEGFTKLTYVDNYNDLDLHPFFLKDERDNPTGSFKDRGMPLMIADAKKSGKDKIAIPSSGNAAISLVTYAKHSGIDAIVFIPKDISEYKLRMINNGTIIKCDDIIESYEDFFKFCDNNSDVYNGFPAANIPYLQGLKTMAYEIVMDLGTAPDWIFIPCGSGSNIVAQYQGFTDMKKMGLITNIPRFVNVQISGADPITVGYSERQYKKPVVLNPIIDSKADALASDTNFNYLKIMQILQETNGLAVSVSDEDIERSYDEYDFAKDFDFSSLSVFAALKNVKEMKPEDSVVLIGTAKKRG